MLNGWKINRSASMIVLIVAIIFDELICVLKYTLKS